MQPCQIEVRPSSFVREDRYPIIGANHRYSVCAGSELAFSPCTTAVEARCVRGVCGTWQARAGEVKTVLQVLPCQKIGGLHPASRPDCSLVEHCNFPDHPGLSAYQAVVT